MKKRILAMLMALVMVVSLLPMTVLAVEETVCPEDHNLDNCESEFIETVEPKCGAWGYNAYKCLECGEIFADEFVAPTGEHNYVAITEAVAPTCTEAGLSAGAVCEGCGKISEESVVIPALGHDFSIELTPDENECYVKMQCSRCDAVEVVEEDHNWSEHPTSIVAPTGCQHGIATYTCVTCDATKEVDVWPNGDHELTEVKEVPATCTETGIMAHELCENCNALFLNGSRVKAEELVIPALGHDEVETIKNCVKTVTCDRCDEVLSVEACHNFHPVPVLTVDATCTTWGYEVYACQDCNFIEAVNAIQPTGHTRWEDADDYEVVTPAYCESDGLATWTCKACGEEQSRVLPALGHNIVKFEVPATCTYFGYTVVYCANGSLCKTACGDEDCSGKIKWGQNWTADFNGDGVEEKLNIAEAMVQFGGLKVAKNLRIHNVIIDVEGGLGLNNHVENLLKREWINEGDCTTDGDYVFYCAYCDHYETRVWDAPGHAWDEGVVTLDPTCDTKGQTTYTCVNCPATKIENNIPKLGHNPQGAILTEQATCIKDGYTYQECLDCGERIRIEEIKMNPYQLGEVYTSKEAMAHHVGAYYFETYREGTCTILGLDKYYCPLCENYLLVAVEGTGMGHAPENELAIVEPTCTEDGYIPEYVCKYCDELVETEILPATGHTLSELIDEVPATCGKDGFAAHYRCETCEGYIDAEGNDTTEDALVIAKLGHDYDLIDSRVASCTEYGYRHYQCQNCAKEYLNRYVEAFGHDEETVKVEATCTEDGSITVTCKTCEVVLSYEVIEAVGHTREDGTNFWPTCDSISEDDECVICGKVEVEHTALTTTTVAATCKDYAYTMHFCADCNWQEVVQDTIAGLGGHTWAGRGMDGWTVKVAATFHEGGVDERECLVCGLYETRDTEPMLGIGLNMSVENAVVAGAAICDSSLIKVTVTVDANDIDAWGYNFTVVYDAEVLEFVTADFTGSAFSINATFTTAENANGAVVVTANAANTETGRTQNVNINEELFLVDLYFRVHNMGEGLTSLNIYEARFIDKEGADSYDYVLGAIADVEIDEFLDINNDGQFDILDCQIAYKILIGEPLKDIDENGNEIEVLVIYDATIDVDKDGEITAVDVQMLYDLLAKNNTYEDMTDCGVEE